MEALKSIFLVLKNWRNRPLEQCKDKSYFNVFCQYKQVKICIEIALNCVETDRHKRPSIGDIICKLDELQTYKPLMSFTVYLSVVGDSSPAGTPLPDMAESRVSVCARKTVTSTPHFDGYQWRKYGQKRLMNTNFPRCYYRCSYHRERNCPATKQVQQHIYGDPPLYDVIYVHDHTCQCHTSASEPEPANGATNPLVSSLAYALQGQYSGRDGVGVPESSLDSTSLDCTVYVSASASSVDARLDVDEGLDVMDYDVTDTMCFDTSYGLRDDGKLF